MLRKLIDSPIYFPIIRVYSLGLPYVGYGRTYEEAYKNLFDKIDKGQKRKEQANG